MHHSFQIEYLMNENAKLQGGFISFLEKKFQMLTFLALLIIYYISNGTFNIRTVYMIFWMQYFL